MATIAELARMSLDVYEADSSMSGAWSRVAPFGDSKAGFFAAVFRKGDEWCLAFRGTDDVLHDGLADLQIALGKYPLQFLEAAMAYSSVRTVLQSHSVSRFLLTGHSLGGGLASLVGYRQGVRTVTFNAPGMARAEADRLLADSPIGSVLASVMRDAVSVALDDDDAGARITNIRAVHDPVSIGTGATLGSDLSIGNFCPSPSFSFGGVASLLGQALGQGAAYLMCQHSMQQLYWAIAADPRFHEEL